MMPAFSPPLLLVDLLDGCDARRLADKLRLLLESDEAEDVTPGVAAAIYAIEVSRTRIGAPRHRLIRVVAPHADAHYSDADLMRAAELLLEVRAGVS